jgi:uncharacterized membrane protein YedE/YeeE
MSVFIALVAGLMFGLGLIISGMANPAKVLGFLDLGGNWDPSLALVMVGAIAVGVVGFSVLKQRTRTWLDLPMRLPTSTVIDRPLVLGSLAFGVGWGLAGYCPGPALVALGSAQRSGLIFVGAMLAGMAVFELLERRK